MVVVDSSAWIEDLVGSPLSARLRTHFPARAQWVVPTMVQLDSRIALRAADLCVRHKLSTADAVIYATALERGAGLLTCDAHFAGLPGDTFMAKGGLN